jgi:heptaprenyl diphosphate synthase
MGVGGKIMVVLQSQFKQELQRMVTQVTERSYHAYVQKYVTYPAIDYFQLHFIYLFLHSMGCSEESIEHYCISQIFIQLGLDTHDLVGLEPLEEESLMKQRQLSVLSGDHFSSYYYLYLAQHNQIELIQKWADVIKEINEGKVDLHNRREQLNEEETFLEVCRIKRKLSEAVLSWFDASDEWYRLNALFTELRLKMENWPTSQELTDDLTHQILSTLRYSRNEILVTESKLWLDYINREHLVSEP